MRKIFIDCGAHCGCSRRKWNKLHPGYEIFSFEPDPELCARNPQLINKAVSIENGGSLFYKFGIDGGSSLEKARADIMKVRKPNYFPLEVIEVATIDLNNFILTNFKSEDYVVLKLDIEGAEYKVLPHLIEHGGINLVKELYIEWHDTRVGIPESTNYELTSILASKMLTPETWDAMETEFCTVVGDPNRAKYHVR